MIPFKCLQWILVTFILLSSQSLMGQSKLEQLILKNDSLIFEIAFNQCQFDSIETIISEDLEFYHDQGGITTGRVNFIASIKNNICSLSYRPRRALVKGSTAIHPLYNGDQLYGAIQMGQHRFYANEEGKAEYFTSIADFSHLWIIENGVWKLKRVLSYNHQSKE